MTRSRREITTNMPMPTGRRQSKIPMGLIETLRFALRDTAAILAALAARGCDAPGSRKSTTREAILDGRKKHHGDESHLGPHRADDECHGAHRTRGLLVADVLDPGDHGGDCTRDVAGDLCRFTPLFGNGRCLCRAIEALSGSRQFLLFRGAVLPESRKALALCAAR